MKTILVNIMIWLILVCGTGYIWFRAAEKIPATKEECESHATLAQAVVDRDLNWNQVLICPEEYVPRGVGLSFRFGRKEN